MRPTDLRGILRYVPQFRERTFVIAADGAIVADDNFGNILFSILVIVVGPIVVGRVVSDRLALALRLADLVRAEGPRAPGGERPIGHLIGPVFDARGRVALALTLFGRPGQLNEGNVSRYATPLLEASARVTKAIGGLWPEPGRG